MNNDIMPPRPPKSPSPQPVPTPTSPPPELPPIHLPDTPDDHSNLKKTRRFHVLFIALGALIVFIILALIALYGWYRYELSAVDSRDTAKTRLTIAPGTSPRSVGSLLEQKHLIRSETVFYVYLVVTHQRDHLQAGTYLFSPAESSQEIARELAGGKVSDFSITFYPGAMLTGTTKSDKAAAVTTQLQKAGYSSSAIQAALAANYTEPVLFTAKPAGTTLEGYVYGDTYNFTVNTPVSDIIQRSLDEFAGVVQTQNLIALYQQQGLTLYQGITLASIIQREINAPSGNSQPTTDQRQVAQVFLSRLKDGMSLGSDVTYEYAAEMLGVTPSPDINSPYNTRLNKGLPPGPIAVPSFSALLAVAHPATTDYLYFVTGDNGTTYFATTEAG
ncbi:MAG TPA: endolytic transglycosylase MltG, partial [Candidatus Saccharimonadaceae bacterium]|nr:endolytic transglycosylase MltG [Candidatus Saccharimonadaceae bacterium]